MRVLVTGGAGFIGSRVVPRLIAGGHTVVCLVRPTTRTDRLAGLDWIRTEGDVRDPEVVARAARGCEALIHLASPSAWHEIEGPALGETNAGALRTLIEAATRQRARVVYVSSVAALGGTGVPQVMDESTRTALDRRRLPYAAAKRDAEALCERAAGDGADVVVVNPAEVYGPLDTTLASAGSLVDFATSRPVLVCTGGTALVHVDDVAEGIVRALERGRRGERYILAGDNLTIRELAELTLRCLGRAARVLTVPNPVIRAVARVGLALRLPLPFEPRVIPYATRFWFVRADKARHELGLSFRSAADTIGPTVAWLRQEGLVS
jgi:dihydroflavonol-4-reductase